MSGLAQGRPRTIKRQVDPIVAALQRQRVRQGLSQTVLAERMGLTTYGTISEHERGVNQPTLGLLRRWAAALGCTIEVQLTGRCDRCGWVGACNPRSIACALHPADGTTPVRPEAGA